MRSVAVSGRCDPPAGLASWLPRITRRPGGRLTCGAKPPGPGNRSAWRANPRSDAREVPTRNAAAAPLRLAGRPLRTRSLRTAQRPIQSRLTVGAQPSAKIPEAIRPSASSGPSYNPRSCRFHRAGPRHWILTLATRPLVDGRPGSPRHRDRSRLS